MPDLHADLLAQLVAQERVAAALGRAGLVDLLEIEVRLASALLAVHAAASRAAIEFALEAWLTRLLTAPAKISKRAGRVYTATADAGARAALSAALGAIYPIALNQGRTAGKRVSLRKSEKDRQHAAEAAIAAIAFAGAGEEEEGASVPALLLVDDEVVDALVAQQLLGIGDHWPSALQGPITDAVREMAESEEGTEAASAAFEARASSVLGLNLEAPEYGAPSRLPEAPWEGSEPEWWQMMASNAVTGARAAAFVQAAVELRVQRLGWTAVGDERTCRRCGLMDGKVFTVAQASEQLNDLFGARTLDEVKTVAPWLTLKQLLGVSSGAGHVSDADSAALAAAGVCCPPLHGRCRCLLEILDDFTTSGEEAGDLDEA